MSSRLEKARQNPDSIKARILASSCRQFADYGFHGTTTRMIAKDVGIDISTLYYHWGEKGDLYEAVITDINDKIRDKLAEVEKKVQGKKLSTRLEIGLDIWVDYLFANPEISNLILWNFFGKNRHDMDSIKAPQYIANIAVSLGLDMDHESVSVKSKAAVIAACNSILSFISGEKFLRPILKDEHNDYINIVKETLKFILIPAFDRN